MVLVGAYFGYTYLFKGTELESKVWLPILLAIGAAIVFANLLGIVQALAQGRAANKPRHEWKDGDLVAVCGPIQPMRSAVTAPFSGTAAALVEYSIKRKMSDQSTNSISEYQGFLMTPCGIYSSQGIVRLIGFPLLSESMRTQVAREPAVLRRAAEYLASCKFMPQASNPFKALRQLTDVLSDDDGMVRADFCKGGKVHLIDDELDDSSENQPEQDSPDVEGAESISGTSAVRDANASIAAALSDEGYVFEESVVKVGQEVTAIGSYNLSKQSIDIGSGFKNMAHSLQIGDVAQVTGRNLRRSLIATLFWGTVLAAGNWYVLKLIGMVE